jgi:hypothetical protein
LTTTITLPAVGGAILNRGETRVLDSNLSYNNATSGGAIFSQPVTGLLAVTGSVFSFNTAQVAGGALYNAGPATVAASTMSRNLADGDGGALYNLSAALTVRNSTLRNNASGGEGGALSSYAITAASNVVVEGGQVYSNTAVIGGGGLWNAAGSGYTATLTLRSSAVTTNSVTSVAAGEGLGGGAGNSLRPNTNAGIARLMVQQSTVAANQARSGGGIANVNLDGIPSSAVQTVVQQSTLSGNKAEGAGAQSGSGGGILNHNGALSIANVTLSDNQANSDAGVARGMGGGIANTGEPMTATLTLLNTTIAFNSASATGGGLAVVGLVTGVFATADVGNTLFVGNEVLTTTVDTATCAVENGTLTSLGANIEDTDTCGFSPPGDRPNTSVALEPLRNNGGSTETHAIPPGSAAFNQGNDTLCNNQLVGSVDQRGVSRPQGDQCDIGAYEDEPGRLLRYFPQIHQGDVGSARQAQ